MDKIQLLVNVKGNRIWLPKTIQNEISNKFIRIHIENISFITKLTKDGRFVIPEYIRNRLNIYNNRMYDIKVELLESLEKPKKFLKGEYIDLLYFVPKQTLSGFEILALEENVNRLILWYSTKGRPNEIIVNRFVPLEFVRLLGYYQAEGGKLKLTKRRGRELNFTNTSLEVIQDFINLSKFLTSVGEWKVGIRFKENINITNLTKPTKMLIALGISNKNVHINSAKRIAKYSVRLWITNSLIAELIFTCMNEIRKHLANTDSNRLNLMLTSYFLQGVIAGDGNIYCIKGKKYSLHPRLCIYEGNEEYINDYSILLRKFGVLGNYVKHSNKNLFIYSGYINKHNLQNVLSNRLLNFSKDNFERLLKVSL